MKRRFLFFLLITIATSLFPVSAYAESGDFVVSLRPSEQELELTPGNKYTEKVTVYNVGNQAFDIEVEVSPYQIKNDLNYEPDFFTENSYTKLANWITFPEQSFHIEAGTVAEVTYDIDVPSDVPGGGQYAAIIIRRVDPDADSSAIGIVTQLASIIHAHIKGSAMRLEGDLLENNFPNIIIGGDFTISSTFENTGNVDYRVTEDWTIRNFFTGQEIITPESASDDQFSVGTVDAAILPDTTRIVRLTWRDAPELGLFRVTQHIYYFDRTETFEKIVLVCPTWLVLVITAFILLVIAWITVRIMNRRRDEPQVF